MLRKVNKKLPFGWKTYNTLYNFLKIRKSKTNKGYSVIVEVKSNLTRRINCEFIDYSWGGIKLDERVKDGLSILIFWCERENSRYPDLVKSEIRDKKLKDLGI